MKTTKNLIGWLAMAVAVAGLAAILSSPDKVYSQEIIRWQREFGAIVNGQYMSDAYSGGLWWTRPTLVDIDSDGDYDMFVGEHIGNINFYRNDGTPASPSWILVTDNYNSIDVGKGAAPTFCDIDNDGDYDMFVGNQSGTVYFYRNDGTPNSPSWTLVTGNYASANVGWHSTPTFCDIDNDGDYDMFVGRGEPWEGTIYFYRNDGTPTSPSWTFVTGNYNSINVGCDSTPTFCDIDNDGDYDMFVGGPHRNVRYYSGNLKFYRNDGTPGSPSWTLVTPNYNSINTWYNTPTFCDIDSDGDYDMFVGDAEGDINFYRNDGTASSPSWVSVPENYNNSIGVGYGNPAFCDIDNDGDYDMFLSHTSIYFWRNDGTSTSPSWTLVTENYNSIRTYGRTALAFCDIDNDRDYDMFAGEGEDASYIHFYRNDGTPEVPDWTLVTRRYASIYIASWEPTPTFCDIDGEGDYDMFVGERDGTINFYRNDGTESSPSWSLVTENYNSIDVGPKSAPTFCDIDNDGDYDMFVGNQSGAIYFYRNDGTPNSPSWTLVTEHYNSMTIGWNGVSFCDIDDDSDYDMFVGDRDRGINFWRNMTTEAPRNFYVDDDATGANDGSSWANAYNYLQDALAAAGSGDEIRVAQGVYKPTERTVRPPNPSDPPPPSIDPQTLSFHLKDGVALKGGYAGFGQPDPNARDIELYETILSGDLAGNDVPVPDPYDLTTEPTRVENSYHVVTVIRSDETAILNGFTITAGNANGGVWWGNKAKGGGMYNPNGASPTVTNCTFSGNAASNSGGGMYNYNASPTLTDCTFIGNSAGNTDTYTYSTGGGICNDEYCSPTVTACTFTGNTAKRGGGIANLDGCHPTLINCTFTGNSTKGTNGGYGSGIYSNLDCRLTVTNCTFNGNSAEVHGGGMYSDRNCNTTVTSCILWDGGDEIWNSDNSVITITYSDVQGGWPGEGNIDVAPYFVAPGYWDANVVWVDGDYHLLGASPCIDAGDPNYVAEPNDTDLDGRPRVIGGRIDMGAFEYSPPIATEVRIVPRSINLTSKGKWITCYIWLGEDYDIAAIDPNSVVLEDEIQAESVLVDEQEQVAIARFSRSEVQEILEQGDVELTVNGELSGGTRFEGTDTIRVIDKGKTK